VFESTRQLRRAQTAVLKKEEDLAEMDSRKRRKLGPKHVSVPIEKNQNNAGDGGSDGVSFLSETLEKLEGEVVKENQSTKESVAGIGKNEKDTLALSAPAPAPTIVVNKNMKKVEEDDERMEAEESQSINFIDSCEYTPAPLRSPWQSFLINIKCADKDRQACYRLWSDQRPKYHNIPPMDVYRFYVSNGKKLSQVRKSMLSYASHGSDMERIHRWTTTWENEDRKSSVGDIFHYNMPMGTYGLDYEKNPMFIVKLNEFDTHELTKFLKPDQIKRGYTHKIMTSLYPSSSIKAACNTSSSSSSSSLPPFLSSSSSSILSMHVIIDCAGVTSTKTMKTRWSYLRHLHDSCFRGTCFMSISSSVTYVNVQPSTLMKLAMVRRRRRRGGGITCCFYGA
jgi:hypothetical protein